LKYLFFFRFLRHHTLATHGYTVVVIDGRGSCHRGLKYESYIKDKLVKNITMTKNYLALSIVSFCDLWQCRHSSIYGP